MLLSILTPCYNGEAFIRQAINSVIAQKNPLIEMIVVDDGSTDNTAAILDAVDHEQIRIIHTDNHGAGAARNTALSQASGLWTAYLDSDDLYIEGSLSEKVNAYLEQKADEDVDIICTPRQQTDMEMKMKPEILYPEEVADIRHHLPMLEFWTCIYRTSYLKANKIRFYEYAKQDVETAFRYQAFSKTDKIEVNRDLQFYLQRINPSSNTHTWNEQTLYSIKALIYYDLFQNTRIEDDKVFLLETAVDCLFRYYSLCERDGYQDQETLKEMHGLFKNVHRDQKRYSSELITQNLLQVKQMDKGRRRFRSIPPVQ